MGEAAIKYKIMPESAETDLDALKERVLSAIPDFAKVKGAEKKPVAFGLNALEMMIVIDDKKGGIDDLEAAMAGVEGVQSVDVLEMGLL